MRGKRALTVIMSWIMSIAMVAATIAAPGATVSTYASQMAIVGEQANTEENSTSESDGTGIVSDMNDNGSCSVDNEGKVEAGQSEVKENESKEKNDSDTQMKETSDTEECDDTDEDLQEKEESDVKDESDINEEFADSELNDSESIDSELNDAELADSEINDAELLDSELTDAELLDSELTSETDEEIGEESLLEGEDQEESTVTLTYTADPEKEGFYILTVSGKGKMTEGVQKEYKKLVSRIVIEEGVTEICANAFASLAEAKSVRIPDSVVSIKRNAFVGCTKLESIVLPENLISIEGYAFMGCQSIKEIVIPESVDTIPEYAFYNCNSLTSIILKQGLKKMESHSFERCASLETIDIPESVTDIEDCSFKDCTGLKSFVFPSKVEKVKENMFDGCTSLKNVKLSDGTLEIRGGAFWNCTSLEEVVLPYGVHTIGQGAFEGVVAPTKLVFNCKMEVVNFSIIGIKDMSIVSYNEHDCPTWNNGCCLYCGKKSIKTGGKLVVKPVNYAYDGKSHKPSAEIYIDNKLIPAGYFKFEGDSKTEIGVYSMTITGYGSAYCESVTATWEIKPVGLYCNEIIDQPYTGKAIKPKLEVYSDGVLLKSGKDYSVTYKNNIAVASKDAKTIKNGKEVSAAPTVVITGKGNYSGKHEMTFSIVPANIENATMSDLVLPYTGKNITLNPVLKLYGRTLTPGKDFVIFENVEENHFSQITKVKEPGDYLFRIQGLREFTGSGNYEGTRYLQVKVTNDVFVSKLTIGKLPAKEYTGSPVCFDISGYVKYKKKPIEDFDEKFTVKFESNTEPGKAKVTITAKPDSGFIGSRVISFNITGMNISTAKLDSPIPTMQYTGFKYEPKLDVSVKGIKLVQGEDYTAVYKNCVNAGTANVVITGINGYSGTKKFTYKISPYNVEKDPNGYIEVSDPMSAWYKRTGSKPSETVRFKHRLLTKNLDYTCTYKNNNKVATIDAVNSKGKSIAPEITITFKGNFKGTIKRKFKITPAALGDGNGSIFMSNKQYSPKANEWKQTTATIYDANGQKLIAGKDYSKKFEYYSDNKLTNNITNQKYIEYDGYGQVIYVRVVGINDYAGKEITGQYYIASRSIAKAVIKVADKEYTGKAVTLKSDDITATIDGYKVSLIIDYKTYKNNINKGTATVVVRGDYGYYGSRTVKFKIGTKKLFWWQ